MVQTFFAIADSLKQLNNPYSKAIRRIAGVFDTRKEMNWQIFDLEIRKQLRSPLFRMCLTYLGRKSTQKPPTVCALLQSRCDGKPLPWVSQAATDLELLYNYTEPTYLPNRKDYPQVWYEFMVEATERNTPYSMNSLFSIYFLLDE